MVRDDLLDKMNNDDDESSKSTNDSSTGNNTSKSSSSGGSSKSSSASTSSSSGDDSLTNDNGVYSMSDEERVEPDDVEISDASQDMAEDAELNYDMTPDSVEEYKRRQIEETEQLYKEARRLTNKFDGSIAQFTVIWHSVIMNLAQNRAGIAQILHQEYGYSEGEAVQEANRIVQEAGETDFMNKMLRFLNRKMVTE